MSEVDLGTSALAVILIAGLISGAVSLWFFQKATDVPRVRAAANRIVAHLLEFRLFSDEPALILKAQRDLIVSNAHLFRLIVLPLLLLLLPVTVLVTVMDGFFGRASLPVGDATVVTLNLRNPPEETTGGIQIQAPDGFAVETPPVRIPAPPQISWRLRALAGASGRLQIRYHGEVLTKRISSLPGWRLLSEVRAGTLRSFLLHPLEMPFAGALAESIHLQYPPAEVIGLHWLVWFTLASVVGGVAVLALK